MGTILKWDLSDYQSFTGQAEYCFGRGRRPISSLESAADSIHHEFIAISVAELSLCMKMASPRLDIARTQYSTPTVSTCSRIMMRSGLSGSMALRTGKRSAAFRRVHGKEWPEDN